MLVRKFWTCIADVERAGLLKFQAVGISNAAIRSLSYQPAYDEAPFNRGFRLCRSRRRGRGLRLVSCWTIYPEHPWNTHGQPAQRVPPDQEVRTCHADGYLAC